MTDKKYNELCALVRDILKDGEENVNYRAISLDDLCLGDGQFTTWADEILRLLE